MAWIQISPRCHSQVLGSGSTAGKALVHARAAAQVDHVMEEVKSSSLFFPFQHFFCQFIVSLADLRNIFFANGIRLFRSGHNRLHGNLLKSLICQTQHILYKVQIVMGKCTSYIILLLVSAFCYFFEFIQDKIIASLSVFERAHMIVYFFSSVDTKNNVVHFFVGKFDDIVSQKYTVGSQGKTKMFVMGFLQFPSIGYQFFYYIEVHQWLAAKEIYFQVAAVSGIGYEKIQCFFADFQAHEGTVSLVLTLSGKAVTARQVAVVGNMQAQCLHYRLAFLEVDNSFFVHIYGKQGAIFFQFIQILKYIFHIFCCDILSVFGKHLVCNLLPESFFLASVLCFIQKFQNIVNHIIHYMNGSAVYI